PQPPPRTRGGGERGGVFEKIHLKARTMEQGSSIDGPRSSTGGDATGRSADPVSNTGAECAAGVQQIYQFPSLWRWRSQSPPLPAGGCGGVAPVPVPSVLRAWRGGVNQNM
ncbi:MAG: hypothetical protein MUC60_04095, partial [Oscillatoria sp. Prado101]|nr:hypothetical protein [Oscillatoria sp. Prado101]